MDLIYGGDAERAPVSKHRFQAINNKYEKTRRK
jgi:hypothetical protein